MAQATYCCSSELAPTLNLPLDVWVLQYEHFNEGDALKWTAMGKEQWWYHRIEPSGVSYHNTFTHGSTASVLVGCSILGWWLALLL